MDCDDAHATVNPDAPERCDGVDNDCDDGVDEDASDATTWYADADGDGHGDADAATVACEAPAGAVPEADDCDDADASAFPGAAEVCDGVDDDCDGAVDEDAADVATFYVDGDGDGYGDPATAVTACEPGLGEVADGTDCDDAVATIHPDAAETDCADPTDYNCDGSVGYADDDDDGVPACEDCDDDDADRSPLLPEVCDDLDRDEDCDALADTEDPSVDPATWSIWYGDGDGDGHGDPGRSTAACEAPEGYVADAADCDDATAAVSPSAPEVCDADNVDEDCDGAADDADASATGQGTWYRDADTDTYGNPAVTTAACDTPAGYVPNDDDCNDGSAAISPADTEVCDASNVDEDCDGTADDADTSATGESTWYLDADGDTYGVSTTSLSRCDQPSGYVAPSTDCDDVHADAFPGGVEVCDDDIDQDCSGADEACPTGYDGDYEANVGYDVKLYGRIADDWFGESMTAGDFDGDGVGDLVVGASQYKPAGGYDGTVLGYYGPFTAGTHAAADVDDFGYAASTLEGSETFGEQVYNLGDLDGDGADDLAAYFDVGDEWFFYAGGDVGFTAYSTHVDLFVSFWGYECTTVSGAGNVATAAGNEWLCGEDEYSSWRGAVYVHSGFSSDDTALATLTGENANDHAGRGVVTGGGGDLDGDGIDDVLVGAPDADSGGLVDVGAAYVVYGPVTGTTALASADHKLIGTNESEGVGTRMLVPGDVDGDGLDDVLVGAPYGGPDGYARGAVYLVTGPTSGTVDGQAVGEVLGGENYDSIGTHTLDAGDFDGDGALDVLASAYDSGYGGVAYVAYGPIDGTIDLATEGASWGSTTMNDYVGYSLAAVPDSDGDDKDEIAIGAILHDYTTGTSGYTSNRGAVYVWLGD